MKTLSSHLTPLNTEIGSVGFNPVDFSARGFAQAGRSAIDNLKSPVTARGTHFPRTPKTPAACSERRFSDDGERSIKGLGRRRTSLSMHANEVEDTEALACSSEDDSPSGLGVYLGKIREQSIAVRYAVFCLPGAILLALPLVITGTPPHDQSRADGIRLLGLFIWIEIIWISFWVCRLVAHAIPFLIQSVCGIVGSGMRKYSLVLAELELPTSMLLWALCAYSTIDVISVFDRAAYLNGKGKWIKIVKHMGQASTVAATIFLVEKIFIQMISIAYYRKQYARDIRDSKRLIRLLVLLYDASRHLFPDFTPDFAEEDADLHRANTFDLRAQRKKDVSLGTKLAGGVVRAKTYVASTLGSTSDDTEVPDAHVPNNSHTIVTKALETQQSSEALARRLFLSICAEGQDAILKEDMLRVLGPGKEAEADAFFNILDIDGNGDVSLEEMTLLVVNCGRERKYRASTIKDMSSAIGVLDSILCCVVIIAVSLIYALFFSKAFASKSIQLWGVISGLSFMISNTVHEFFQCCIFLFVKHPYDVGDCVVLMTKGEKQGLEKIVKHTSLFFTVFKKVDTDSLVQVPHNLANDIWIENFTRSREMKERFSWITSGTCTNMQQLLTLRKEMEKFVRAPENCRDFSPDVDLEISALIDIRNLELRIEIRHRGDWANQAIRLHRRNKFMVALWDACTRVGLEQPGGVWGPHNPVFTAEYGLKEQSECAEVKKEKYKAALDNMYPGGMQNPELAPPDQKPEQTLYTGLKKRNPYLQIPDAGRRPSIWSPI
ncbi:unnamed protein product [Cercospora beticola]|nr:unnamed protein product [Cercospora beticola]